MIETGPEGEDAVVESEANGSDAGDKPTTNGGGETAEHTDAEDTSGGIDLVPAADDDQEGEEQKRDATNGGRADGEGVGAEGGGEDASAPSAEGMP